MQNSTNWDLAEGKKTATVKSSQDSNTGAMAATTAAFFPRGNAFPQPPGGFFDLYGTGIGWNGMTNMNWSNMMR